MGLIADPTGFFRYHFRKLRPAGRRVAGDKYKLTVSLPGYLFEDITREAEETGRSRNYVIVQRLEAERADQ